MYRQLATTVIINILKYSSSSYNIVNNMDNNKEIISRLKFIGKINKGEKINTRHMYVQPDGVGTMISRTFLYQDNRGNTLNFCQETINRSFELLITFQRSNKQSEKNLSKNLIDDLKQAITGLTNLKYTYTTDTKFCCDMDTILEHIHARLDEFIEEIPESDISTQKITY